LEGLGAGVWGITLRIHRFRVHGWKVWAQVCGESR